MSCSKNSSPDARRAPFGEERYFVEDSPCYSWTRSPGLFDLIQEQDQFE